MVDHSLTEDTWNVTIRNPGVYDSSILLHTPDIGDGFSSYWENSSWQVLPQNSIMVFRLNIQLPTHSSQIESGTIPFFVSGEYRTSPSTSDPIDGYAMMRLTVNALKSVDVVSFDSPGKGDPGDDVAFEIQVTNNGNVNDKYKLSLHLSRDTQNWSSAIWFEGLESGNTMYLGAGRRGYFYAYVSLREFDLANLTGMADTYPFFILATSLYDENVTHNQTMYVEVEPVHALVAWTDEPSRDEFLLLNEDTNITHTFHVRNLGNAPDDIDLYFPNDQFYGNKRDWRARFIGGGSIVIYDLQPGDSAVVTVILNIDWKTDPGGYTLDMRVDSLGDSFVYQYAYLSLNLRRADYGLDLFMLEPAPKRVNPRYVNEIDYIFRLRNTGNVKDSYHLYFDPTYSQNEFRLWEYTFYDLFGNEIGDREVIVPGDVTNNSKLFLETNETIYLSFTVSFPMDTPQRSYNDITLIAVSEREILASASMSFNITIINPNIRISNDPDFFFISPDKDLSPGSPISVHLRIFNDGTDDTESFSVVFYNGKSQSPKQNLGSYLSVLTITKIPAESYRDVNFTWESLPYGSNSIFAYADKPIREGEFATHIDGKFNSNGNIIEHRETDNYATIGDQFLSALDLRPDLMITNIRFVSLEGGTTTDLSFEVKNQGTAPAPGNTVSLTVKIGSEFLQEKGTGFTQLTIMDDIIPGHSLRVWFLWDIPNVIDTHTLRISLDSPDDSDHTNDKVTTFIAIKELKNTGSSHVDDDGGSGTHDNTSGFRMIMIGLIVFGIIFVFGFVRYRTRTTWSTGSIEGASPSSNQPPILESTITSEAMSSIFQPLLPDQAPDAWDFTPPSASPHLHASSSPSPLPPTSPGSPHSGSSSPTLSPTSEGYISESSSSPPPSSTPVRPSPLPASTSQSRQSPHQSTSSLSWQCSGCGSTWDRGKLFCWDCGARRS